MKRIHRPLLATSLVVPMLVLGGFSAPHVYASSQSFTSPGKSTFTVPVGVTALTIDALGGQGGNSGGLGGETVATIPVAAGSVLEVFVGGAGTIGGVGANGGGGANGTAGSGGDASDVRTDSNPPACAAAMNCPNANRVVVAGGGGGNESCGGSAAGRGAGGLPAVNGYSGGGANDGGAGGAGTNSSAGAGGAGAGQGGQAGSAGDPVSDGDGGGGGISSSACNGGGGGGGLNGGGGGGGTDVVAAHAGGGGGGSSFGPSGATFTTGVHSGNGAVTITYQVNTTTTIASGSNPNSSFGDSVNFTALVSPTPASGGTGYVQFSADGVDFGSPVAVSTATGSATSPNIATLSPGTHAIQARFLGNADFAKSSTLAAFTQVVTGTATITAPVPVPNTGAGSSGLGAGSLATGAMLILFGFGTVWRRRRA